MLAAAYQPLKHLNLFYISFPYRNSLRMGLTRYEIAPWQDCKNCGHFLQIRGLPDQHSVHSMRLFLLLLGGLCCKVALNVWLQIRRVKLMAWRAIVMAVIKIMPLILTFGATVHLAKGNLKLSPQVIAASLASEYSPNPHFVRSLCAQSADTWIGIVLLLLALTLQLLYLFFAETWEDFFTTDKIGLLIALAISGAMWIAYKPMSQFVAQQMEKQTLSILSRPAPESKPEQLKHTVQQDPNQ